MIIGIIGGIASGKSAVANILSKKGYKIINGDTLGKLVVEKNRPAYSEIVGYFGEGILQDDGSINREKLGDIVFTDKEKLAMLNRITHKYIYNEAEKLIRKYKEDGVNNIAIDAALLYEIGLDVFTDYVWFVDADKELRIKRLMERNNLTLEKAKLRIEAQTIFQNMSRTDALIEDNGDINELEDKITELIKKL